mmetsp:Transcript_5341/g.16268  ORF Transcript_5341/g.16268 Transcript_5341/m.16268 type:complete len:286 (+) Transcript_5341:172-1029(+)
MLIILLTYWFELQQTSSPAHHSKTRHTYGSRPSCRRQSCALPCAASAHLLGDTRQRAPDIAQRRPLGGLVRHAPLAERRQLAARGRATQPRLRDRRQRRAIDGNAHDNLHGRQARPRRGTREKLPQNDAQRKHVGAGGAGRAVAVARARTAQHLRRGPRGCTRARRDVPIAPRQPEVAQFWVPLGAHKHVHARQVAMADPERVQVRQRGGHAARDAQHASQRQRPIAAMLGQRSPQRAARALQHKGRRVVRHAEQPANGVMPRGAGRSVHARLLAEGLVCLIAPR